MPSLESLFREAALASFHNASELHDDAVLLFEHGRYPRAVSLSVIGTEEVGKAVLFTVGTVSSDDEFRTNIRTAMDFLVRQHDLKQTLCEMAALIATLVKDEYQMMADETGCYVPPDDRKVVDRIVNRCAQWISDSHILDAGNGRRKFRMKQAEMRRLLTVPVRNPPELFNATSEERRWAGLYVDLTDDGPKTPERVLRQHALSELANLEAVMKYTGRLQVAFQHEGS